MPKTILKNSVTLIAGGGKNLGGLFSRTFAAEGAKIALHFNSESSRAEAEKTAAEIAAKGGEVLTLRADFTKPVEIAAVFAAAKKHFGKIDIAINTVGKVLKKSYLETTEEEYDEMAAVNAKAAYFFIQEAGRHLEEGGKILTVVTSLLAAYTGLYSTYAGGKAPVEHFTRAASKEFGPRGISVTAVGPGPMDTPFFYGQETPEAVAYQKSASALSGLTMIEDIVPLIQFLVTDGWRAGGARGLLRLPGDLQRAAQRHRLSP